MSAQIVNLSADPTFAIIRKYKAAVAAFNAYHGPDEDETNKKLERASNEAQKEFKHVVPTTPEASGRRSTYI
jgi:hypothetical protein